MWGLQNNVDGQLISTSSQKHFSNRLLSFGNKSGWEFKSQSLWFRCQRYVCIISLNAPKGSKEDPHNFQIISVNPMELCKFICAKLMSRMSANLGKLFFPESWIHYFNSFMVNTKLFVKIGGVSTSPMSGQTDVQIKLWWLQNGCLCQQTLSFKSCCTYLLCLSIMDRCNYGNWDPDLDVYGQEQMLDTNGKKEHFEEWRTFVVAIFFAFRSFTGRCGNYWIQFSLTTITLIMCSNY